MNTPQTEPETVGPPSVGQVFTAEVQGRIRAEIEGAGGAEVSLYGRVDAEGRVCEVQVAARGHMSAAPALIGRADGWDVAIHNHPSGLLLPSDADLDVAIALAAAGCAGFMIVSNDVEQVYVVVPPASERRIVPLEPEEIDAFLGADGPIAAVLGEGYEPRAGQMRMAHQVAASFVEEGIAILESGTGTGKTFAYLVPATLHALRNGERVVVSTATINLQGQIAGKDVPNLALALARGSPPRKLEVALVKGRGNYVSLRRAAEAGKQDPLIFGTDDEREEVLRLAEWARQTPDGDKGSLSPPPSREAWEHVSSQADNCLGARCPRFGECHYYASKRRASRAQLLIANHHLLFADLAIKQDTGFDSAAVLPPFSRVILDEAHHIESIASDHFGAQLTERGVAHVLGRLRLRRRASRGLLPSLLASLLRGQAPADRFARMVEEELLPLRDRALSLVEDGFDATAVEVQLRLPQGELTTSAGKLRLSPRDVAVLAPLADAQEALALLGARLGRFCEEVGGALAERDANSVAGLLLQLKAAARRIARSAGVMANLLKEFDPAKEVRWVELSMNRRGHRRLVVRAAPLDVGPLLREALWKRAKTAVLSSATLAVQGRFDYLRSRIGLCDPALPTGRVRHDLIPSPFDYPRQAVLAVPTDMPLPGTDGYEPAVIQAIRQLVLRSRGRAFVLFTSYGALRRAYRALNVELQEEGLVPLQQGDASREALLQTFLEVPRPVLFATASFWEGVDVPGDRLVLVVIPRLPFSVPNEPLQEARAEAVELRGGNPFRELQLPRAVLKLTQGFGRLIRTTSDQGAVVVLDRRLLTRWYGRAFFESLPPVRIEAQPLIDLLPLLKPYVS